MVTRLDVELSDLRSESWWMQHANCKNMDISLFFLEEQTGFSYDSFAREVCDTCDVSKQCLDYANRNMYMTGLFGGMSPKQREKYRAKSCNLPG
jgi:WhiB family redox-sensing transcriptional regulator